MEAPKEDKKALVNKRLQRAKTGKMEVPADAIPKPGVPGALAGTTGLSLDLSTIPKQAPEKGDHKLDDGQTLTTPRAKQEEALTVRGQPKHKQRQLFKVGPEKLGDGKIKFAWRGGEKLLLRHQVGVGQSSRRLHNDRAR